MGENLFEQAAKKLKSEVSAEGVKALISSGLELGLSKTDIISKVAKKFGMSEADAKKAVEQFKDMLD